MRISSTGDGGSWQAEAVELTVQGEVNLSKHSKCKDNIDPTKEMYKNMIPYQLRDDIHSDNWTPPCPAFMTIPQFKAMGVEYTKEHAAAIARTAARIAARTAAAAKKEAKKKARPKGRIQPARGGR